MAIGGLWVPRERKHDLTKQLQRLRRESKVLAEVKWTKTSTACLESYKRLVDFFFDDPDMCFRSIVVEHAKVDAARFHGGDAELGFYKFYYEMLIKWMEPGNRYLVLLDFKHNKGSDRYTTLHKVLKNATLGSAEITDLTVINSADAPLGQICDLLTGAVAASWCKALHGAAKAELADHIARRAGFVTLRAVMPSPAMRKLNIFRIDLDQRR